MTMTLSLLVPQELGFALLGTISTVPIIWLLTTTVYSWAVSTATVIEITGSGSVSSISNGDDDEDDVIMTIDGNEEEGMECAAAGQEDDALALELERPKPTSIQNVNFGVESEDGNELEHNPMGLQTWPNGMIFAMIYSPLLHCDLFIFSAFLSSCHAHQRFAQTNNTRGITFSCLRWWTSCPCYPRGHLVQHGYNKNTWLGNIGSRTIG